VFLSISSPVVRYISCSNTAQEDATAIRAKHHNFFHNIQILKSTTKSKKNVTFCTLTNLLIQSKHKIMQAHEIDYQIFGEEKYVEIELDPQEIVIAEAGSFMMMDNNIQMETIFGDGSEQQSGLFGKL
jgi:hypothetical protein